MNNIPRSEYPRPDFERDSFDSLNGEWEFAYDDEDLGIAGKWYAKDSGSFDRKIMVPFTYLAELSGIGERDFHDIVWYRKKLSKSVPDEGRRILLHFGAIDYISDIWVNGEHMMHHEGGNTPVDVDITDALDYSGEQNVVVRAFDDSLDFEMPRGKQFWEKESDSIFYTRTVGIWQSVWMEEVPAIYIDHVKLTPDVDKKRLEVELVLSGKAPAEAAVRISYKGQELIADRVKIYNGLARVTYFLDSAITHDWNHQETWVWSPEHPVLFDIEFDLAAKQAARSDHVKSYFALRKIAAEDGRILLNNRPYYMKLLLDQGYFRKGLLTAPSDEDYVRDIKAAKEMGFNGVRKHQKVEDPRFLYWADQLGFIVWGEAPSAYEYTDRSAKRSLEQWPEILRRDYNHPSIVAWVPLNESWGVHEIQEREDEQAHSLSLYYLIKSLDTTRLVISNDGWMHTKSDILTIHDYSGDRQELTRRYESMERLLREYPCGRPLYARGFGYNGEPVMVTEFGGISYSKDGTDGWGYTSANGDEDFLTRYKNVVEPLLSSDLVQGFVYTQITDIEQEINGLMTYDREFKADPARIRAITEGKG